MKVVSSIKNLKKRDRDSKVIKRRGRIYVINKKKPRMKARQGWLEFSIYGHFRQKKDMERIY